MYVRLAEWARANGVHPQTAYRWFREDRMPVPARRLESGTIYFPSSKTCSACGCRKPSLTLADRMYACDYCGVRIDRDLNAAVNLARLDEPFLGEPGPAGSGPVAGRGATRETEPARAGNAGGRETSTPRRPPPGKTGTASPQDEAA